MPGVFVVTDSSCDLDQDEIDPFNIEIVPLTIRFGSEEFTDRQDLSVEAFYQRMANTEDLPQTACPSPGAFEQAFHAIPVSGMQRVPDTGVPLMEPASSRRGDGSPRFGEPEW